MEAEKDAEEAEKTAEAYEEAEAKEEAKAADAAAEAAEEAAPEAPAPAVGRSGHRTAFCTGRDRPHHGGAGAFAERPDGGDGLGTLPRPRRGKAVFAGPLRCPAFEHYESCHPGFLRILSDLAVKGSAPLSSRWRRSKLNALAQRVHSRLGLTLAAGADVRDYVAAQCSKRKGRRGAGRLLRADLPRPERVLLTDRHKSCPARWR